MVCPHNGSINRIDHTNNKTTTCRVEKFFAVTTTEHRTGKHQQQAHIKVEEGRKKAINNMQVLNHLSK